MVLNLYNHRQYILRNAWGDLRLRYAGTGMGVLWNIFIPVSQIVIYSLVFGQLMGRHMEGLAGRYAFVLYLCSGLLPWLAFSGALLQGSNAFLANSRYLKNLPVPEEIFVAQTVMVNFLDLLVYIGLLVLFGLVFGQPLGWTILLLPVVAILLQVLAFGIDLSLAPLRVFFMDIGQILSILTRLWMWTLPIVYVESILPEWVQRVFHWNPVYPYIAGFRDLFLYNHVPHWTLWAQMLVWAFGFTLLGFLVLQRLRLELRDAL